MRPSIVFMSSGVSLKSNTWKKGKIALISPPRSRPPPGDWRIFQLDGDIRRGQGSHVCPQLAGEQGWEALLSSHLSFPHLLLLCPPHKHYSTSVPYLSKWITCDRKQTKIFFFQTHCLWTLLTWYWTWANMRLIASPQHTLRVTAFSWSRVGRRLPLESLFRNLISNYSLSMIEPNKNFMQMHLCRK